MASYQELKNKIKNEPTTNIEDSDLYDYNTELTTFELEETRYMLNLIANNDFKGRDVQIVYNIALKLQNLIKKLKD